MNKTAVLTQPSLVIIFAFSPTGLGHLRVTDALYHGLPETASPILLGAQDKSISTVYRFISINPFTRSLFEWTQQDPIQYVITEIYRWFLSSHTHLLYQQVVTILDQRLDVPKTVLLIATHFGLAHQLAAIKEKLAKEKQVRAFLVVQVTDDSPQYIWYIPRADLTVVPSHLTLEKLRQYSKKRGLPQIRFAVAPYPISPNLSEHLLDSGFAERQEQVNPESKSHVHICVPISGAAVGTDFNAQVMETLFRASDRFVFHVVSKQAPYTHHFLADMLEHAYVHLHVSSHDRETVDNYEKVYKNHVISLEITKPSEQAFKALVSPHHRGGSLLLFAKPVGKQEYDNLDFLRRHGLIPSVGEQKRLWELASASLPPQTAHDRTLVEHAHNWRGVILPVDPHNAATYILWCLTHRVFATMMHYRITPHPHDLYPEEVAITGVQDFWEKTAELLDTQPK